MSFEHIRKRGGFVIVQDGDEVSGILDSMEQVRLKIDKLEREAKMIERPCLCCGHIFTSEGPHNRMCTPCRSLPAGMD